MGCLFVYTLYLHFQDFVTYFNNCDSELSQDPDCGPSSEFADY